MVYIFSKFNNLQHRENKYFRNVKKYKYLFDLQPIQIFLFYLKIFTMKKIFTIVLVLSVFLSFGQRPQVSSSLDLQKSTFGVNQAPKTEVDTLIPGNWANATGFSVYWFSEAIGYVFGTNTYSDKAYGQQFSVDEPMELTGGIFWIAYADGTVGNVIFTVWDFVDGAPGAVLVSKAIPIADVVGSTTLANAITVYFDDPIVVEGDFVVGVDFSELEAYVPTTKRLGHVSSQIGMGGNLGLVWVKESDDGWFDVMGYTNPIDVDLGIFPFVVPVGGGDDGFSVTFNVDMTAAEGFDPAEDHVFVTGNFTGWAQPGTEGSVQMQRVVDKSREVIYFQDFEGETFPPTGWAKINPDDGTGWKIVTSGTSPVPGWSGGTVTGSPDGGTKMAFCTWDTGGSTSNDQWLVSPKITVGEDYQLSFYLRLYTANYDDNVDILVSKGAQDVTGDFSITLANLAFTTGSSTEWTLYTYDLTAHAEINVDDEIYIAFREHVADNFNEGSAIFLDQVKITGTGGGGGDDLIYTATVNNIAEGELLYKYFSNAFGAGWDGGEWAGDPNRSFMVEANAVLNDIWGQQPNVSVDEIQLDMVTKVFPNPVRNTLYIQSQQNIDYLRLFDMAGRVVFQADVMDNQTTIDATQLGGGLYILQMVSGQQVKTHKIQVVK